MMWDCSVYMLLQIFQMEEDHHLQSRYMPKQYETDSASLTVQLLSAFVSRNEVASDKLAELIKTTRAALTEDILRPTEGKNDAFVPATSVRKSIASPDFIISLIDGKPYKTLKRHLRRHGLSVQDYRDRYNLPATYPMVAPSYSKTRREVAKNIRLGKKPISVKPGSSVAAKQAPSSNQQLKPGSSILGPGRGRSKKAAVEKSSASIARRKKLSIFTPHQTDD